MPVAVNADSSESDVRSLSAAEVAGRFDGTGIAVAQSEADLLDAVAQSRSGRSFWFLLLLAVLGLLVIESLLASRSANRPKPKSKSTASAGANTNQA